MSKNNQNKNKKGTDWTSAEIAKMKELLEGNTPTGLLAYKLGRTESAVRSKAAREGISLKPINKSPYNRR